MPHPISQDGHGNGNYADLDYSGIHEFTDYNEDQWGSFEVFKGSDYCDTSNPDDPNYLEPEGWYWWTCYLGCLPDSDPIGPFSTSAEAYRNAQGF